jgi:hypothetical protein
MRPMWLIRALMELAARTAVGVGVALAVAALDAVVRGGSYADAFALSCVAVGVFTILLGAVGQSPTRRIGPSWFASQAKVAAPDSLHWMFYSPSDMRLSTGAVFFLTGAVLIALGLVLG